MRERINCTFKYRPYLCFYAFICLCNGEIDKYGQIERDSRYTAKGHEKVGGLVGGGEKGSAGSGVKEAPQPAVGVLMGQSCCKGGGHTLFSLSSSFRRSTEEEEEEKENRKEEKAEDEEKEMEKKICCQCCVRAQFVWKERFSKGRKRRRREI